MNGDHLRCEHALDLVARSDAVHRSERAVNVHFCERLRLSATATGVQQFLKGPGIEVGRGRTKRYQPRHHRGLGLALGGRDVDRLGRPMIQLHPRRPMPGLHSFAEFS